MINIPASYDFIKVNSAFGGMAIYDKSQIPTNARYSARDENNEIICDHPTFNEFITESGGVIYINPKLVIGKIPEKFHSWINYKKFITKIFWLTKGLNSFLNKNFIGKLIKKLFTKISNSF